jgi:hypothetical protein
LLEYKKHSQTKLKYYENVPDTNGSCLENTAFSFSSSSSALGSFKFVLGFPHDRCPFSSVPSSCSPIFPHPHSSSPIGHHPTALIHIFLFSFSHCVLVVTIKCLVLTTEPRSQYWVYDIFPTFRRSLYKIPGLWSSTLAYATTDSFCVRHLLQYTPIKQYL